MTRVDVDNDTRAEGGRILFRRSYFSGELAETGMGCGGMSAAFAKSKKISQTSIESESLLQIDIATKCP
jgi:hypothetical protein